MSEDRTLRRVILLGRKQGAAEALKRLLARGITVTLVVAEQSVRPRDNLFSVAKANHIPVCSADGDEVYRRIAARSPETANIDLVISYLFHRRIRLPLITLPRRGCINFHPAPLPDYKGRAGYNTAILDGRSEYGVSAHVIDSEAFDSGPIIKVNRFPIDTHSETAFSLEQKAQPELLALFDEVLSLFESGKPVITIPNNGGLYMTKPQLEALKQIDLTRDRGEDIDRKIRAFFFPPYTGATIKLPEGEFTLVNQKVLEYIARRFTDGTL